MNDFQELDNLDLKSPKDQMDRLVKKAELTLQKELEVKKLKVENFKAWGTVFSIPISLIVTALTIGYGLCSQNERAKLDFELKAAELIMSTEGPHESLNRAKALTSLFPERLPNNLADSFQPEVFSTNPNAKIEAKKELLLLIAQKTPDAQKVIEAWKSLFPDDDWVAQLDLNFGKPKPQTIKSKKARKNKEINTSAAPRYSNSKVSSDTRPRIELSHIELLYRFIAQKLQDNSSNREDFEKIITLYQEIYEINKLTDDQMAQMKLLEKKKNLTPKEEGQLKQLKQRIPTEFAPSRFDNLQ